MTVYLDLLLLLVLLSNETFMKEYCGLDVVQLPNSSTARSGTLLLWAIFRLIHGHARPPSSIFVPRFAVELDLYVRGGILR